MNANELRALHAPLKQQYQDRPETAFITLKAQGKIGDGVTCRIDTGRARAQAGLHPATGGDALSLCSGDLDFRGTPDLLTEVPVGFQDIRVSFGLNTDALPDQLAALLRLTERYCVVFQTLSRPPLLSVSHRSSAST